ncbi:flavodoxin family protein [Cellulomonas aerilata]|uniref:NAD(P)H:quinone oxidoreductase type IV n=1 Tax=Cellulomonas aerilata TaxID=515326 RepID=A0A512D7J5_9CELL|nr:NAD(P)H-dependent oxidoreductase [Cellulomonas aerilata]GEO32439.1 NAD(P)H:quinone oxidoreductase type IV [Cellulomonas aerilata]
MSVKVAIVYYSSTGTVQAMAERLERAASAAGAQVRRRHVTEIAPGEAIASNPEWADHVAAVRDEPRAAPDDLVWADVVLLGSPTRFGNVSSQLQQFMDTLGPAWSQGQLADKVYAGFTASQTAHGGQESTLLALYQQVIHFGGILVTPGYTDPVKFADGNPYGVSHATGADNDIPLGQAELDALDHLAERTIRVAERLQDA